MKPVKYRTYKNSWVQYPTYNKFCELHYIP